MDKCKVICVEGPDKSGKQTQTNMLYDTLAENHSVTLVEVPVKGLTHKAIYWMLRNGTAKKLPNFFQFVQFLNKLAFQLTVLPTLKAMSDYVILDRWSLSAIVYGDATGVNARFNRFLYDLLMKPDVVLVMHGASYKRSGESDSYEKDSDLQMAVKKGYWAWAMAHNGRHKLIHNVGTRDEVHARIMCTLIHDDVVDQDVSTYFVNKDNDDEV